MKSILFVCFFFMSSIFIFAQNPYEEMGILHNEKTTLILKQIKSVPTTTQGIKTLLDPILREHFGTTLNFAFYPGDMDINSWIDGLNISALLKVKVKETIDLCDRNLSVQQFWNEIVIKEKDAPRIFAGDELRIYYEHLAVAKYSYKYWMPVSKGGMNGISNCSAPGNQDGSVNMGKVFVYDCVGGIFGGALGYIGASVFKVMDDWWD